MTAKAVLLADAIVSRLNEEVTEANGLEEFSKAFAAQRRYTPFLEDKVVRNLQVYVLTNTKKAERTSRDGFTWTFKPVVVVQQKIPSGDEASRQEFTDSLQQLVDEIEVRLADADFTTEAGAFSFVGFDEEQDRDAYLIELLRDAGRFGAAITLEYSLG